MWISEHSGDDGRVGVAGELGTDTAPHRYGCVVNKPEYDFS